MDTDFGLGFTYPMIDANAQSITKEPGQKILQFGWLSIISSNQGTLQLIMSNDRQDDILLSTSLIQNWNSHIKHCLK